MSQLHAEVIVTTVAVPMCIVGLFGNISLLWATTTEKRLHHKSCYIVAVIAFLHVVCLLCELYIEARQLRFRAVSRSECFRETFVYVFALVAQSAMFFMMALDYLLAVTIPLRHRVISALPYVFCMCIPSFLLASASVVTSVIFMNEDQIDFCTPIRAMPHNVVWLSYVINFLNIGVLVILLSVFALLGNIRRNRNTLAVRGQQDYVVSQSSSSDESKMMRSFVALLTVFVCSWCFSAITTHIALHHLDADLSLVVQTYTVILALPTYCQCYFITYIRSPRHRSAYRKQQQTLFTCLFSGKPENSIHSSVAIEGR